MGERTQNYSSAVISLCLSALQVPLVRNCLIVWFRKKCFPFRSLFYFFAIYKENWIDLMQSPSIYFAFVPQMALKSYFALERKIDSLQWFQKFFNRVSDWAFMFALKIGSGIVRILFCMHHKSFLHPYSNSVDIKYKILLWSCIEQSMLIFLYRIN